MAKQLLCPPTIHKLPRPLIFYRVNLDPQVAKEILVYQEKKETLDRLVLVDLLEVQVTKELQVLRVLLVHEEIQVKLTPE